MILHIIINGNQHHIIGNKIIGLKGIPKEEDNGVDGRQVLENVGHSGIVVGHMDVGGLVVGGGGDGLVGVGVGMVHTGVGNVLVITVIGDALLIQLHIIGDRSRLQKVDWV